MAYYQSQRYQGYGVQSQFLGQIMGQFLGRLVHFNFSGNCLGKIVSYLKEKINIDYD